jgi:hypothetical protein
MSIVSIGAKEVEERPGFNLIGPNRMAISDQTRFQIRPNKSMWNGVRSERPVIS